MIWVLRKLLCPVIQELLAPSEMKLKPFQSYTPHTHSQIRLPYQFDCRFSTAEFQTHRSFKQFNLGTIAK